MNILLTAVLAKEAAAIQMALASGNVVMNCLVFILLLL